MAGFMEDSPFLPQLKQWASWGRDREEDATLMGDEIVTRDA